MTASPASHDSRSRDEAETDPLHPHTGSSDIAQPIPESEAAQPPAARRTHPLGETILATHLRASLAGLLCVILAISGGLLTNFLIQKAEDRETTVRHATATLSAGLDTTALALRTAAYSGSGDFIADLDHSWTDLISRQQKRLAAISASPGWYFSNFRKRAEIKQSWSRIEKSLYRLDGTQTSLKTMLSGSSPDSVYHLPAANIMNLGREILERTTAIYQKRLAQQNEIAGHVQEFQELFHKAHADILLYFLQDESPEIINRIKSTLEQARKKLDQIDTIWPKTWKDEYKEFRRINEDFNTYTDNTLKAIIGSQAFTPKSRVESELHDLTELTRLLHRQLNEFDRLYIAYNTVTLRNLRFTVTVFFSLSVFLSFAAIAYSVFEALRLTRRINRPLETMTRAARNFHGGERFSKVDRCDLREMDALAAIFNDLCDSIDEKLEQAHDAERQALRSKVAISGILTHAGFTFQQRLKKLKADISRLVETAMTPDRMPTASPIFDDMAALMSQCIRLRLYSSLEADEATSTNQPFDCVQMIRRLLTEHGPSFSAKGLTLVSAIDPDLPRHFLGDRPKIAAILSELLSNAAAHTSTGGACLSVTTLPPSPDQPRGSLAVRFRVNDTGPGMKGGNERLLMGGSPLASTGIVKPDKFGLGFLIAGKLAQALGAHIRSATPHATGMSVELDLDLRPAASQRIRELRRQVPLNILLIENCEIISECLTRQMLSWGATVTQIKSPREILDQLRDGQLWKQGFDCIIVNEAFAGGRLDELDDILRAVNRGNAGIRCILITSNARAESVSPHPVYRRAQKLPSPVNEADLYKALTRAAGRSSASEETPAAILSGLPAPASQATIRHNSHAEILQDDERPGPKTLKILVAEPENGYQVVLTQLLRELGYTFHRARTGDEALRAMQSEQFDLVLMGISLPGVNGLETARRIKRLAETRHTPIVAMAPAEMSADLDVFEKLGLDGHLTQPVDINTLEDILKRFAA